MISVWFVGPLEVGVGPLGGRICCVFVCNWWVVARSAGTGAALCSGLRCSGLRLLRPTVFRPEALLGFWWEDVRCLVGGCTVFGGSLLGLPELALRSVPA